MKPTINIFNYFLSVWFCVLYFMFITSMNIFFRNMENLFILDWKNVISFKTWKIEYLIFIYY